MASCSLAAVGGSINLAEAQLVTGRVVSGAGDAPVVLATVTLFDSRGSAAASVLSDDNGEFALGAPEVGEYVVRAESPGYWLGRVGPVELREGRATRVRLHLDPRPIAIEGVDVEAIRTGRLAEVGFWDRQSRGRGQFLTSEDILTSGATFTPHLFRSLDHVIGQEGAAPWTTWVVFRSASYRGRCEPKVFVDGVWMNRPGFGIRRSAGLDEVAPLHLISGVEVYWGPFQAPIRFQGTGRDAECGVVLIWTREPGGN